MRVQVGSGMSFHSSFLPLLPSSLGHDPSSLCSRRRIASAGPGRISRRVVVGAPPRPLRFTPNCRRWDGVGRARSELTREVNAPQRVSRLADSSLTWCTDPYLGGRGEQGSLPNAVTIVRLHGHTFLQRGLLSVTSNLGLDGVPNKTLVYPPERIDASPCTMALMRGLRPFFVLGTNYACKCSSSRVIFARAVSTMQPLSKNKEVTITFVKANGERIKAKGNVGDSILDIVVNNDLDLGGYGACEGTLTCSTCHLVFPKDVYDDLPDEPSEEELDMLELAQERGDTSRLGCQITMTEKLDGIEVRVPATINDARQT